MTEAPAAGQGTPISPETQRWLDAAAELAPAKVHPREVENGKFVVSTVSTVGVLLTGFGLVAADRLSQQAGPRLLAVAAVAFAVVAVLLALFPLILRTRRVNVDNLAQVKAFYASESRKAHLITAAGYVLCLSLALAGAGACWAAATAGNPSPDRPLITLVRSGSGADTAVHASVKIAGLEEADTVEVTVSRATGGTVVLRALLAADRDGTAELDETVDKAGPGGYVLTVERAGHRAVTVNVDG